MGGRVPERTPLVRVLLVDDDADFLLIWRLLLSHDARFGQAEEAGSGEEALRQLRSSARPDVVVSDLRMGAVSGFDVLDVVLRTLPGLPVVLTSGVDELRTEALGRGATAFFAKSDTTREDFAGSLWTIAQERRVALQHADHPVFPQLGPRPGSPCTSVG